MITLAYYRARGKQPEQEERAMHGKIPEEVAQVVSSKKIIIFEEMSRDVGYDGMEVVNIFQTGVWLVGILSRTGIWKKSEDKLPRMEVRHLWASAETPKNKAKEHRRTNEDHVLNEEVWSLTEEEVKNKLLIGPSSEEELVSQVGELWVPA